MEEENDKFVSKLRKYKGFFIGIATILLIIFMIVVVDFISLINRIYIIGFFGLLIFIVAYTTTFILRGVKLKLIFKGIDQDVSFTTSYFTTGVSFIINDLTPAKLGDFAKMAIFKDQETLKLSDSICSITIERVLDLVIIFSISCITVICLYFSDFKGGSTSILRQNIQVILLLSTIFLIGIFIFFLLLIFKTETIVNIVRKFSTKLADLLRNFIISFKIGIRNFKSHKKKLVFIIIINYIIWIIEILISIIFFIILLGDKYQVIIFVLILAIVLTYLSKIFPITPGGWGITENIGTLVIFIFYPEIPYTLILSIFIIEHLFRSGYLFFYGGTSMLHYNIKLKDIDDFKGKIS